MKKNITIRIGLFLLFLGCATLAQGQASLPGIDLDVIFADKGEAEFTFQVKTVKELATLTSIISIAGIHGDTIHAFANRQELARFLLSGYQPVFIHRPYPSDVNMMDFEAIRHLQEWDFYPTYEAYLDMMAQFEVNYPELCRIENIGTLPSGRVLLAARISDQIDQKEGEPQFLYTSSMHGNETGGYVLMLRLIHHLLSLYGTDPDITWLVDNIEIWINPLANPDGTYAGGNNTVAGATRGNAYNVDLNRNYPDPEDGAHPDGNPWQPETMSFMELAAANQFVMGANFHSGSEVVNYPWDTWARRHADDAWWINVSYEYVDTVHAYSDGYFYGQGTGVTNGYDWYEISGGRQDFMTYFHHGRECTIEISDEFIYPASQLPVLWEYNYRSLLNYMRQCTYGVAGTITDETTGDPVRARIMVDGHDLDSSHVYSCLPAGNYYRFLAGGTYDLEIRSSGYFPVTIADVSVYDHQKTHLDIQMTSGELIADFSVQNRYVPVGGSVQFTDESYGPIVSWSWIFEGGSPATSTEQNPLVTYPQTGTYSVTLTVSDGSNADTMVRSGYMNVSVEYTMQNGEFVTCSGLFYDSGGEAGNYGNNQNRVMTFLPDAPGKKLTAGFIYFHVEPDPECDYDWLRIFDGPGTTSPLIGTYCGSTSPGMVTATNEQGALTFQFHSDNNVTGAGWKAEISCDVSTADNPSSASAWPILIFPNPAREHVLIRFQKPVDQKVSCRIYSSTGILITQTEGNGITDIKIDTHAFGQGVYFVEIGWRNGRIFRKLILQ